jgi:hypothetical protein
MTKPYLSKSCLISAWQCPRRLYLEKFRPELAEISDATQALFATGHEVGAVAKRLYGTPDSVEIPFNRKMSRMVDATRELLAGGARFPIFEATFEHDGILVRADVLIPSRDAWRLVEVKASTSVKDYHVLDSAIQEWVLRNAGVQLTSIHLAHINNQFVYAGDGDYNGLFAEHDLTDEVKAVDPRVEDLVASAREAIAGGMPEVNVGAQCGNPFDCPFINFCWPMDTQYPISGLGGSKAKLGRYVAAGYRDICDVPADEISAETQMRIHHVTCAGEPEILDGAREIFSALDYPRYHLDFETIAPAVPFWAGTRPYEVIPVQWSCHVDDGTGNGSYQAMRHEEFLDLSGSPPMRALAESLIETVGDTGPVLMYTNYEERVIRNLIDLFPDLKRDLKKIIDRLFDLHPVVKDNYYHPDMLGSWSIKAVLPTINPNMDYKKLEGIQEGTAASNGFLEAINPDTDMLRKLELEEQLRRYCRFDTEAMAEIVRFLQGHGGIIAS